MQCPAEHYTASSMLYDGLPDLDYPLHDETITVTICGRICFNCRKINPSQVFAGRRVGIKQRTDRIWLVPFMDRTTRQPVRAKSVTYVFGITHVSGLDTVFEMVPRGGIEPPTRGFSVMSGGFVFSRQFPVFFIRFMALSANSY
jgi:hypothetical protein